MVFINCWKPLECGVCECADVRTTVCILLKGVFFHVSNQPIPAANSDPFCILPGFRCRWQTYLIQNIGIRNYHGADLKLETRELIFLILAHAIVNFQWTTINTLIIDIFHVWFEYICERSIESDISLFLKCTAGVNWFKIENILQEIHRYFDTGVDASVDADTSVVQLKRDGNRSVYNWSLRKLFWWAGNRHEVAKYEAHTKEVDTQWAVGG